MTNQLQPFIFSLEVKMNKIISKLRVTELDSLSDVLVRIYKDATADETGTLSKDENLSAIMAEVENLSDRITTAIKSDRVTSTLEEADIERDTIVRNLADAINGYAAIPVPSKKAAAEKLLAVFSKYGKQIISKNYAEESSLIESMLEDFSGEALKTDIETLDGIGGLLEELRNAQNAFNKASDDFTNATVNKGESATSIKRNLLGTLNDQFIPYISAVAAIPAYRDFSAKCSSEIDRTNAAVSGRAKKSAK